jgi:hypothetical protein
MNKGDSLLEFYLDISNPYKLWINKIWYIYTMEYYLAIEKSELLIHAMTRMHFENTMLSVGASHGRLYIE